MARPNQSRERILDAAANIAADRGVSAATIDRIAEAAGVAKGSVYYNFETKEAVFETIMDAGLGRMCDRLDEALGETHVGAVTAELVRVTLHGLVSRPHTAKIIVSELFRTDRVWRDSLKTHRDMIFRRFSTALERDGRPSDTVHAAAIFGATIMVGFELLAFTPDGSIEEGVAAIVG